MTRAYGTGRTLVNASLQYLGIAFSFVYGVLLFDDRITWMARRRHAADRRRRPGRHAAAQPGRAGRRHRKPPSRAEHEPQLHHPDHRRRSARAAGRRRRAGDRRLRLRPGRHRRPANAPGARATCPARTTCTWTATCRAPRPAATAATRCPSAARSRATLGRLGHHAGHARWSRWIARAARTPRGCGGCCAGWATTRWPCSTAACTPGARPAAARRTPSRRRALRPPYPDRQPLAAITGADALAAQLGRVRLLDARAGERFRGEVEPLDAAAGHIPGALNRFFKDNLAADGRFKPAAQLRAEFARAARRRRRGTHGAPVRLGRDRLPQPAGDGARRPDGLGAVPRLVERMVVPTRRGPIALRLTARQSLRRP